MAKIEILTRKGTGTMKKLKIFLTLLSVVIIVVPVAFEVLLYRDNLLGLIVPPEMINLFNRDSRNGDGGNLLNSSDNGGSLISDNSDIRCVFSFFSTMMW